MSQYLPTPAPSAVPEIVSTRGETAKAIYQGSTGAIEDLDSYSRSRNTVKGYLSDWAQVRLWAASVDLDPLPAAVGETVTLTEPMVPAELKLYIAERQDDLKSATLVRHLSAVRWVHHQNNHPSPTDHPEVKRSLSGLRRKHSYQPDRAKPLFLEDLRRGLPEGVRDRALLLVGWWGALRRSELVGIDTAHISDHPEGVIVRLPKSKTDQVGQGQEVALHYRDDVEIDPVRALRALLAELDGPGAVFRSMDRWGNYRPRRLDAERVSALVKDLAERVGLDPQSYSAHSLRAGFVSECDRRHIPSAAVRAVTRHTSDQMLNVYERPGELFDGSAGAYFEGV